jgi:hypothetical protein
VLEQLNNLDRIENYVAIVRSTGLAAPLILLILYVRLVRKRLGEPSST